MHRLIQFSLLVILSTEISQAQVLTIDDMILSIYNVPDQFCRICANSYAGRWSTTACGVCQAYYNGWCDDHDIQWFSLAIHPGNTEYNFWILAVTLIQEDAGWGGYGNLINEFEDAVEHRNLAEGTLDFSRMPSLEVTSYGQALRRMTQLLSTTFDQWYWTPSCDDVRLLVQRANRVMVLRQRALANGRRRGDNQNTINCHEYALSLWTRLVQVLEAQFNELYRRRGRNCNHPRATRLRNCKGQLSRDHGYCLEICNANPPNCPADRCRCSAKQ